MKKENVCNKVLVVGVFDLFHRGHVELIEKAAEYGEVYILLNGDDFTEAYKRRPIISENDRLKIVTSLKSVAYAEITNSPDVKPFIDKFQIKIIIHGDDWSNDSYLKQICINEEYIAINKIKVIYTPYYSGTSTSKIIKKIRG